MKTTAIAVILFCLTFYSCYKQNKIDKGMYNGIDKQLLDIVDSLPLCDSVQNFVTFSFTTDSSYNLIVKVYNGLLIPAPPELPEPYRDIIITETDWFVGYKKYKNWYILFDKSGVNNKLSLFVERDSLIRDEKPFIENDVYNYYSKMKILYRRCEIIEMVFRINEKDSLVMYQS